MIDPDVLAATTIYQEARGEEFEGMVAVAMVIRNRMRRGYSSDGTVAGTVLKPWQFSGWNTQDPNRIIAADISDLDSNYVQCQTAWVDSRSIPTPLFPAVLYHATSMNPPPSWSQTAKVVKVATIGNHVFYDEPR